LAQFPLSRFAAEGWVSAPAAMRTLNAPHPLDRAGGERAVRLMRGEGASVIRNPSESGARPHRRAYGQGIPETIPLSRIGVAPTEARFRRCARPCRSRGQGKKATAPHGDRSAWRPPMAAPYPTAAMHTAALLERVFHQLCCDRRLCQRITSSGLSAHSPRVTA
jgi:hypothetical protein